MNDKMSIREFLFDIGKIVEGAANSDHAKVVAYIQQLGEKLDAAGEAEGAKRLRQILGKSKAQKFGLARTSASDNGSVSRVNPIPVDTESRLSIADESMFQPGEVQIYLAPDVRGQVDQFLLFNRQAERLRAHGVGIAASMLIYGPPGSGKTQLAKYIAAELGLPLITARTDGLISSYLGSTAKNVRSLFDHAASRPCVLFLDEFDALAKKRDDAKELGELKRVVISLLQNIDALGPDHVLLAASNHEHLLDPAVWRRFTYKIHLGTPDRSVRSLMLARFLREFGATDDVEVLSALSDGLTGAQLQQIADDAIRAAVLVDARSIKLSAAIFAIMSARRHEGTKVGSTREQLHELRRTDHKIFTQARLAKIYGLSQSQISKLLKGEE